MLKMSAQIENIVSSYKTLSKIPAVIGGTLNRAGNKVTAKLSVRAVDKSKSAKFSTNYVLDSSLKVITQSDFGADVSNELLSSVSPKESYRAVIREETNSKDAKKKQFLEVWSRSTLQHCIDLTTLDVHGDVYADSEFGCLDWSQDETAIVYVAEKKQAKLEPYLKRKAQTADKANNDGSGETAPRIGEEYLYRQDWGEQLVGKYASVIVVCRLPEETVTVLDHLPAGDCPGQVRFTGDGRAVVGAAWHTEPRRLGLIFCTNRPSYIFSLTLAGELKKLSGEGLAVRSPRVTPSGDLIWLQRTVGGPHHACHQLVTRKHDSGEVRVVIDIVQTETAIRNGSFTGVYCQALPAHCFTGDGRVVFSTPQEHEIRSYVVDINGGSITDISTSFEGSLSVLDVKSDVVLATYSTLTTPSQLFVAKLPQKGSEDIAWVRVSEPASVPSSVASATVKHLALTHSDSADDVKSFSALYFAPAAAAGGKLPLVVWPHGGPHSSFVNSFSIEAALFNMLGFACLLINYRGSTGAGESSIAFLPSRCGAADVQDCAHATAVALATLPLDPANVFLTGGSHGGFLVTHLSGQHPGLYAAVVTRNPVTDVAAMYNYTDINDWSVEDICYHNPTFLGLAVLRVNYRGSTGQGEAALRSLISKVGAYDVADCCLALTSVREREGVSDVVLFGASYGGLVVGHLAARMEGVRAVVMRNPLIDLATKGHYADNSDGCAVEAGFAFTESGPVSEEHLLAMRRCSPLAHAHKVRAPTALMLGSVDKRVPYYQGLEYARRLKANGVETRVYMYEDNHSLSSLPAEVDNLINGAHWFMLHLKQ